MTLSNRSLPKPETWQEFEHHAWLLFRSELKDPATEKNGRQGQSQHGVDVYGQRDGEHWVGVQCKQKMDEGVSETELREEVEKAKSFEPKISEYILVTTARRDANIQKVARTITDELKKTDHAFSVSVWGWDQFQEHASQHSDVWEKIDPTWDPYTKTELEKIRVSIEELRQERASASLPDPRSEVRAPAFDARLENESSPLHTKITIFVEMVESGEVDAGRNRLANLRESEWETASPSEKYRILIGLASSALKVGDDTEAFSLIDHAFDICPDHKSAKRNLATSKLLRGDYGRAAELAQEAFDTDTTDEVAATVLIQARSFDPSAELLAGLPDDLLARPSVKAAHCQAMRNRDDPTWTKLAIEAYDLDPSDEQTRLNWADAVLELEIRGNAASAQGGNTDFPKFADLNLAADYLAQACISRRSRFSMATIHNAGVASRLVDKIDQAKQVLEIGLEKHPQDSALGLQLAIIAHEERDFGRILELLDPASDQPEIISLRIEACARTTGPEEALEKVEAVDSSKWSEEHRLMLLSAELSALSISGDWATAVQRCERAAEEFPNSIRVKILQARVLRISGNEELAKAKVTEIIGDLPSAVTMAERIELATECRFLECFDQISELLDGYVSSQHDSEALRLLLSALVTSQRHRKAVTLMEEFPPELSENVWFLRARAILAVNSGASDVEKHLDAYLRAESDDLEMQITRMGLWQLQNRLKEIRNKLRAFEKKIPDGNSLERMRLCHLAVQYGNKKWGVETGYQELIANWDDPAVHLAYQGLILMYDGLEDAIPETETIQENCVFETKSHDGLRRARIEEKNAHNFEAERHSPSSDFAKACLGKSVGEKFTVTTQYESIEFEVLWIKPRAVDLLHRSMEEFNKRFPMNSGMQRVSIDFESDRPLEGMERIAKAAHDRDQSILDKYAKNALPFCFIAEALGKDPIDGWAGLPGVGIQPRVCIGSLEERNSAITQIQSKSLKGCVLDPITASLASDFHLWTVLAEICGPVHVTQSTLELLAKREIEAQNNIDRQTGMSTWQGGRLAIIEITPEQNRAAYEDKKRQREDILANCKVATAVPPVDLEGRNFEVSQMLGASARDTVFAAAGSDLLLVSEDQGLRQWAGTSFEVSATWLQPIMLLAKDRGLVSIEDYTKFIVDCVDCH